MGKERRKKRIKVRVTEEELNRLRDIASELNSTLSDVLRRSTFSDKHDYRINNCGGQLFRINMITGSISDRMTSKTLL